MNGDDAKYAAMLARDYRFDGKFFVGVKTTGVYCRPICPARPKRQNVEFFRRASEAERHGYRPCLRCRPEAAPASPAWLGKSAVVQRALRAIAAGILFSENEEEFAAHFGMSARHLRRLFTDELGQTPKQISDVQRLNFARSLVVETRLSITDIAMGAGFASLRRFNEAFKERFRRSPSELRRGEDSLADSSAIELSLAYRPPFDWTHHLDFFERHAVPFVERVVGGSFERVIRSGAKTGLLRVTCEPDEHRLVVKAFAADVSNLFSIVRRIRAMFDLDCDPLLIANAFESSPFLTKALKTFPGVRMPGAWDFFETSVQAILGQVVSVDQAGRICRQLVERLGEPGIHPLSGQPLFFFPGPKRLAEADLSTLPVSPSKRNALRELSRAIDSGRLSISDSQEPEAFRRALVEIPGIGKWTAEYLSLRLLGDTDSFPRSDLVLRRALARNPESVPGEVRPWRSYAALLLWKSERSRRGKAYDHVAHQNAISGRSSQARRERRSSARGSVGAGSPQSGRITGL